MNVVGQVLRRHGRILDERHGPAGPLGVAEEADGALAHLPDRTDRRLAAGDGVARAAVRGAPGVERRGQAPERRLHLGLGMADELDEVQAAGRTVDIVRDVIPHCVPDDVPLSPATSTRLSTVSTEAAPAAANVRASRSAASKLA